MDISSDFRNLNKKTCISYFIFCIWYFVSNKKIQNITFKIQNTMYFYPHHQIRKRWTYHRTAGILIGISFFVFCILYFTFCSKYKNTMYFHPPLQIRKRWTYHQTSGILIKKLVFPILYFAFGILYQIKKYKI